MVIIKKQLDTIYTANEPVQRVTVEESIRYKWIKTDLL